MVKSRPFTSMDDLAAMKRLLSAALRSHPHASLHPGDLDWRFFATTIGQPREELLRLWHDAEGTLLGFLFAYPSVGAADLLVQPSLRGSPIEAQMIHEAEPHLVALADKYAQWFQWFVFGDDIQRRRLFESRGSTGFECRVHLAQTITDKLLTPRLPAGFSFLEHQAADYAEKRAEVHAAAFDSPPVTYQRYKALVQAPNYDPTLDVVVVAPDGQWAAFALAWADTNSKVGVFEPVGTRPRYQRMGLGKAAIEEAMRRMQARGIDIATVRTQASMTDAIAFYQAVGFAHRNSIYCYQHGAAVHA
ncbi:MAG: GNAT family N-acetyltransferase [Anaerolineae bacterium]